MACRQATERLKAYEIHGIDVSHYQGNINWETVAKQDIQFAFVKATEGQEMRDKQFAVNWKAIDKTQVKKGAYHFFRPSISSAAQAKNFIEQVKLKPGDLPPVLDVEVLDNTSPSTLRKGMKTWLEMVEQHYNIRPVIYTNLKFYQDYIQGHFDGYPLWIARYNYRPPLLSGSEEWQFWQYGNRGRLPGIQGNVDFNVFCGRMEELEWLCLTGE